MIKGWRVWRFVLCFALQTDIDEFVKEEVYEEIHSMEYAGDSYVWVNEILKWQHCLLSRSKQ